MPNPPAGGPPLIGCPCFLTHSFLLYLEAVITIHNKQAYHTMWEITHLTWDKQACKCKYPHGIATMQSTWIILSLKMLLCEKCYQGKFCLIPNKESCNKMLSLLIQLWSLFPMKTLHKMKFYEGEFLSYCSSRNHKVESTGMISHAALSQCI
jgi:hypothetical protein